MAKLIRVQVGQLDKDGKEQPLKKVKIDLYSVKDAKYTDDKGYVEFDGEGYSREFSCYFEVNGNKYDYEYTFYPSEDKSYTTKIVLPADFKC
jgi:hypothetical protein